MYVYILQKLLENCKMNFNVKRQTNPGQKGGYKVSLHNEHGMPSCECHSWMWNLHPCKHIFAVINSTNELWEFLPQHYRSSPYFTVDFKVMGFPVAVSSEGDEEEEVEQCFSLFRYNFRE